MANEIKWLETLKHMKVGITGTGGFIGDSLLKRVKLKSDEYTIFEGDLLDAAAVERFAKGCNQIIHLAGILSDDFERLMAVNLSGTRNIAESCKRQQVGRLIFSSTGAVYGEPLHNGISHEDDPLLPNTLYGLSKLYAEEYIRYSGVPSVILRFPNVYGPRNNKGVIYNFLKSIKDKGEVNIWGSGEQKRNFLFVDDAVDAIISVISYTGADTVFNISDRSVYSLNDVVRILKNIGFSFEVKHHASDESNALQTLSEDISRAEKILKWCPTIELMAGIGKIIKHTHFNS